MYPSVIVLNVLRPGLLPLAGTLPRGPKMSGSDLMFFVPCPPAAPAHAHSDARPGAEDRRASRLEEGRPQESAGSSDQPGETPTGLGAEPGFVPKQAPLFCDSGPGSFNGLPGFGN